MVINSCRFKKYELSIIVVNIISFLEVILGFLCTQVLFFIENGEWGGTSFFGAVLLLPLLVMLFSKMKCVSFSKTTDLIAPSGLAMYAINKLNCYIAGCCAGKLMKFTDDGVPVYFPSQICELVTTLLIILILFLIEKNDRFNGKIYPIALVLYGISRFVLGLYRDSKPFVLGLPIGNIWALISILIGVVWIFVSNRNFSVNTINSNKINEG